MRLEQGVQSKSVRFLHVGGTHGLATTKSVGMGTVLSGICGIRGVTYTRRQSLILKKKMTCLYIHDWSHRYDVCDLPCKSERGVRIQKIAKHKTWKMQDFKGHLMDEVVKVKKWDEQQAVSPVLHCQGVLVDNGYKFV